MQDAETKLIALEQAARERFCELQSIARMRLLKVENVPPVPPQPSCGQLSVDYWQRPDGLKGGARYQLIYRIYGKGARGRKPALAYLEDFLNESQTQTFPDTAGRISA